MPTAPSTPHDRLRSLLLALGAEPSRPRDRADGLTDTIRLDETDTACITAAGENTAVITVVTTTEKGRRILKTIARAYGMEPGNPGL